ncbi:Phosphoribosylamine--glycine ligase [invertebrate metagenome]|uniref:phosphoribosylamine--glycine ligase n=1 Tax=invertebrate metagenome TaxID=1711999 RepID=A0A484H5L1_9ZZZZ
MRVLVVGSGGREHALCWALRQSPLCERLFCAPGNAGIAAEALCIPIATIDTTNLVAFAQAEAIDLVVIGPEAPLINGLADHMAAAGIRCFGPSAQAALLEGSKGFMKDLLACHGVPTAEYRRFHTPEAAWAFIRSTREGPIVVKADGLATGKGVILCRTLVEAERAIDTMMVQRIFGSAGDVVVIEALLEGEEISFFALVDGRDAIPLAAVQDYKAVGEGNTGANTGGMGAFSPLPVMMPALEQDIMTRIILPTVHGMAAAGRPFKGVLFAGLIMSPNGPKVLEFNVRFGDPECQVLMMRLRSDLLPLLLATCDGLLASATVTWHDHAALAVIMATQGYPGPFARGSEIRGLETLTALPDVKVFHAATRQDDVGRIFSDGGRVLGVTAVGPTVPIAQARAYATVRTIDWPEGFYRRDIGQHLTSSPC